MMNYFILVSVSIFFLIIIAFGAIIISVIKKRRKDGDLEAKKEERPDTKKEVDTQIQNKFVWVGVLIGVFVFFLFLPPWEIIDWSKTTPGKTIDSFIGEGWANWIIWLVVFSLMIWLMNKLISQGKVGSGGSKILSVIVKLAVIGVTVAIFIFIIEYLKNDDRFQSVAVDLRNTMEKEQEQNIYDTIVVIRPESKGLNGYWICPDTTSPNLRDKPFFKMVSNNGGTVEQITLTDESRAMLAIAKIGRIKVKWKLVLSPLDGDTPCLYKKD